MFDRTRFAHLRSDVIEGEFLDLEEVVRLKFARWERFETCWNGDRVERVRGRRDLISRGDHGEKLGVWGREIEKFEGRSGCRRDEGFECEENVKRRVNIVCSVCRFRQRGLVRAFT